jgi:hypothetical protein
MAKVVLPFERYQEVAPLPPVCIRCGAPATRTIKMQFTGKRVKILGITLLLGSESEYVVVDTPLCDGHPFMGQAKWMWIIGFLLLLPLIGLGALLKPWVHHYLIAFPLIAIIVVGAPFVFYVMLTSIGGEGFAKEGVTVTGVSREFIDALEEHDWTEDEFITGLRRNRKARKRPKRPLWMSPWFFVPVGYALAIVIFTPLGYLVASRETYGAWPAGQTAADATAPGAQPGPAPLQGGPPVAGPVGPGEPAQPAVQQRAVPLDPQSLPGLLAYWPLDEGFGKGASDKSGHGFLAFIHGSEWVPGVKGQALRLDGKKDYVDLGPDARLNFGPGAPFTVAGWAATEANNGVVCSFRKAGGFGVIDILIKDGQLHGWVRDDTSGFGGARLAGGQVKDGKWHHAALLRRADGTAELYLDGVFQVRDKGKSSGGPITTDLRALGSERFIAKTKKRGPTYLAGTIDEFCVFGRDLAPEEIVILAGGKRQ